MSLMTLFDYGTLDMETRVVVQQKTGEIKDRLKRTAQDIVEIGERLIDIKERLGHGRFGEWLKVEFEMSHPTANNLMSVAESFKFLNFTNLSIAPSALYALSAPSVPEAARKEAVERATNGEHVNHTKAKEVIAKHKPPVDAATMFGEDDIKTQARQERGFSVPEPTIEPPAAAVDPEDEPMARQTKVSFPADLEPSDDPEAEARQWKARLVKLRDEIELVVNGICGQDDEGSVMTAAPKWFKKDLQALEAWFRELRDAADVGIRKFKEFRRCDPKA